MIDWMNPDWSYMLGVVHGDGSIAPRSIDISVGYKDAEYADVLISLWKKMGFDPKTYRPRSSLKIAVHSANLQREFAPLKQNGTWFWPEHFDTANYVAGIVDTDGYVGTPLVAKRIVVTLKRSGNLSKLADILRDMGMERIYVKEKTSTYNGKPYEIEELLIHRMEDIATFSEKVRLRHFRKAERLLVLHKYITDKLSKVSIWKQVGLWLQEEPRTWEEIAENFNLTKDQVDSVLQNLKRNATVKVIPPPKSLTKYHVSGLSSSQE